MALPISRLIVALTDKVTGPAKAIAASLHGVRQAAQGSFAMRIGAPAGLQQASMVASQLRGNLVDAGAMAYGAYKAISGPITASARFQTVLTDIRQKADMTAEEINALGAQFRGLAPQVNLSATEIAKAADILMGMGLDPKRTMEILKPIGMVSTAYGAEVEDVSKMTFAMLDNLKIAADDIPKVLDMTALAGKEGAFELKDMAKWFAGLTAQMQAMKMTGPGAAAKLGAYLQVVRKTAGNSDEAANNLRNLFTKMYSDDTVKDFKKVGINIRKELDKAEDPIERFVQLAYEKFGGNKSELAEVLGDQQAQLAALAIIQNPNMASDIYLKALKAQGVVLADFNMRMKTTDARVKTFRNRMEDIGISIGSALEPALHDTLDVVEKYVAKMGDFAKKNPKLISAVTQIALAFVGLRLAVAALRFAFGWVGAGISALLRPLGAAAGKFRLLSLLRPGPLLLVGAAGKFIADNWKGIGGFFDKFGASVAANVKTGAFDNVLARMDRITQWATGGSWKISEDSWEKWGDRAGRAIADGLNQATKVASDLVDLLEDAIVLKDRAAGRTDVSRLTSRERRAAEEKRRRDDAVLNGIEPPPEPNPELAPKTGWFGLRTPSWDSIVKALDPSTYYDEFIKSTQREMEGIARVIGEPLPSRPPDVPGESFGDRRRRLRQEGRDNTIQSFNDFLAEQRRGASDFLRTPFLEKSQSGPVRFSIFGRRDEVTGTPTSPEVPAPEISTPIGDAAEKLGLLDRTVSPSVNTTGVDRFIAKVKEANGEMDKLEGRASGLDFSPAVGGVLGRSRRGSFATE